ncbi:MAG: DUF3822 family protein [Prevotella sp.]|nr:DUF3822 family protein [Prevotella sp.]
MQATGNNDLGASRQRITIRASQKTLSFSSVVLTNAEQPIVYEPYPMRSDISIAANMREALRTASLPLQGYTAAQVMVESPVLMIPFDVFDEEDCNELYKHTFADSGQRKILHNVLPNTNSVALFPINKDLKMVIDDHFNDVIYIAALSPVWNYLYRRSFTGVRNKLYAYFHDSKVDIFSYQQNRFRYTNQFNALRPYDAIYFMLYVWKLLGLRQSHDELHIVGDIPEKEVLVEEMRKYVHRVYVINPAGDFNRAAATKIEGMPYDLMTLYTKGR